MGKIEKAVDDLSQFLDTFYNDVEGWLELAELYSSVNQFVYFNLDVYVRCPLVELGQIHTRAPGSLTCSYPGTSESLLYAAICRNCIYRSRHPPCHKNVPCCDRYV
jgi:hypothetical protein